MNFWKPFGIIHEFFFRIQFFIVIERNLWIWLIFIERKRPSAGQCAWFDQPFEPYWRHRTNIVCEASAHDARHMHALPICFDCLCVCRCVKHSLNVFSASISTNVDWKENKNIDIWFWVKHCDGNRLTARFSLRFDCQRFCKCKARELRLCRAFSLGE